MVQPDSPAELGGKIYEMMALALGGRWGRLDEVAETEVSTNSDANTSESFEAEVVEPSEVRHENENDPWTTD